MMASAVSDIDVLLKTMEPMLQPGVYVFARVEDTQGLKGVEPLGMFRETEGLTVIVREEDARHLGLPMFYRAAWISLSVFSDLAAAGLTAAVSTALSDQGISCNVVAAVCHDHLFVPVDRADEAMMVLHRLQRNGAGAK